MKWRLGCVLAAMTLPGLAAAQAGGSTCEAAHAELPYGAILDLLDPTAPEARRREALTAYERLATMQDCPEFGYTIGQLYRHGEYLPGNLLPQDLDKARALIRPMAESGYLPAFADLAEMEMRHANAREAMQWTQVYLHFVDKIMLPGLDPDQAHFQYSAYNGNLLNRVDLIWRYARPSLPRKLVKDDLNAYLDLHGTQVAQRMRARQDGLNLRASAQDGGPIRVTSSAKDCYVNAIDRIGAASVTWIVEVLPSGQPGRVVLENFVPKPEVADAMQACLARYAFAPFEGTQSATIRIPLTMGSTEGAAISRKRRK